MIRRLCLSAVCLLALAAMATPARAGGWIFEDHYALGLGWTNKYKSMASCPGGRPHPWNPFLAVPFHSSLGQTGPRRMLLWTPTLKAPLYNNTPGLVPIPPEYRRPKGNCPYIVAPNGGFSNGDCQCEACQLQAELSRQQRIAAQPPGEGVLSNNAVPGLTR